MENSGKQKIWDALCRLAVGRPVSQISISELTAEAGVHRSTFYYYFESTQDVLEKMAADVCRQYLHLLAIPAGQTAQTIDADSRIQLERKLCAYVDSVSHRIRFLLSPENYQIFRHCFQDHYYQDCHNHPVVELGHDGEMTPLKQGIVYDYYVRSRFSELFGTLEFWAERDFSEGPEEFIQIIDALRFKQIARLGSIG